MVRRTVKGGDYDGELQNIRFLINANITSYSIYKVPPFSTLVNIQSNDRLELITRSIDDTDEFDKEQTDLLLASGHLQNFLVTFYEFLILRKELSNENMMSFANLFLQNKQLLYQAKTELETEYFLFRFTNPAKKQKDLRTEGNGTSIWIVVNRNSNTIRVIVQKQMKAKGAFRSTAGYQYDLYGFKHPPQPPPLPPKPLPPLPPQTPIPIPPTTTRTDGFVRRRTTPLPRGPNPFRKTDEVYAYTQPDQSDQPAQYTPVSTTVKPSPVPLGPSYTQPGEVPDHYGGGSKPKRTNERFMYKNKERVVYKGSRGGKYIKLKDKFVSIRKL